MSREIVVNIFLFSFLCFVYGRFDRIKRGGDDKLLFGTLGGGFRWTVSCAFWEVACFEACIYRLVSYLLLFFLQDEE